MLAAAMGDIEIFNYMLEGMLAISDYSDISAVDINYDNAIWYALNGDNMKIVDSLVEKLNKKNPRLLTTMLAETLISAVLSNSENDRIISLLSPYLTSDSINDVSLFGIVALNVAVLSNKTKIVSLLLDKKADPHLQDYSGATAFTIAAENNNIEMISLLAEKTNCPNVYRS